jgi:hypothetical protein
MQRPFSCAIGFRHGLKKSFGALDRAGSARAIYFPSPRLWQKRLVLYDNGKVFVIDHGGDTFEPCWETCRTPRRSCISMDVEAAQRSGFKRRAGVMPP